MLPRPHLEGGPTSAPSRQSSHLASASSSRGPTVPCLRVHQPEPLPGPRVLRACSPREDLLPKLGRKGSLGGRRVPLYHLVQRHFLLHPLCTLVSSPEEAKVSTEERAWADGGHAQECGLALGSSYRAPEGPRLWGDRAGCWMPAGWIRRAHRLPGSSGRQGGQQRGLEGGAPPVREGRRWSLLCMR